MNLFIAGWGQAAIRPPPGIPAFAGGDADQAGGDGGKSSRETGLGRTARRGERLYRLFCNEPPRDWGIAAAIVMDTRDPPAPGRESEIGPEDVPRLASGRRKAALQAGAWRCRLRARALPTTQARRTAVATRNVREIELVKNTE